MFKFILFILFTVFVFSCSSQKEVKKNENELDVKSKLKTAKEVKTTEVYFLEDKKKYPVTSEKLQIKITSNIKSNSNLTREYDFNGDGKVDMMVSYNKDKTIDKIYSDLDFDLKHDVIDYYKKGKLSKRELLSDVTQKPHITIIYNLSGEIKTTLFDRNLDGRPDEKSLYKAGKLYQVLIDSNSDGKFNVTKKIIQKNTKDEDGK